MNGLCYEVPFGFLDGDGFLSPELAPGFYNSLSNEQFTSPDAARFNQTIKYGLSSSGMAVKYFVGEVSCYYNTPSLYFGEVVMIDNNFQMLCCFWRAVECTVESFWMYERIKRIYRLLCNH